MVTTGGWVVTTKGWPVTTPWESDFASDAAAVERSVVGLASAVLEMRSLPTTVMCQFIWP